MYSNGHPSCRADSILYNESEEDTGTGEKEKRSYKLFMGQIPSSMKERNLKNELSHCCRIDHVAILRDSVTKKHKHCAFVYVSTKEDALLLIQRYNNKVYLPGMSSPVRMEFAVKKKTRSNENQNELIDNQEVNDYGGVHMTEESLEASQSMIPNTSTSYVYSSCNQSSNILYFPISPVQNSISIDSPSVLSMIPLSSLYPSFPSSVMSPPVCSIVSDVFGYHTEGPKGANLFIYHLPTDIQESFLFQLFSSYGTVVSVNIYRDRVSNVSKGFGFVSMSSVQEADRAIKYLNGYHIHGKILKVERKKEKD